MVTAKRGDWQGPWGDGRPHTPTVHNGHGAHPDAAEIDFSDVGPAEHTAFTAWKAKQQPSWRDREPRHVHSVKWVDSEGCEHLHIVRADDIDTVLKDVAVVKLCIAAAKQRAAKKRQQAAQEAPQASEQPSAAEPDPQKEWCAAHNVWMTRHQKGESAWYSHKVDGKWCRGGVFA